MNKYEKEYLLNYLKNNDYEYFEIKNIFKFINNFQKIKFINKFVYGISKFEQFTLKFSINLNNSIIIISLYNNNKNIKLYENYILNLTTEDINYILSNIRKIMQLLININ